MVLPTACFPSLLLVLLLLLSRFSRVRLCAIPIDGSPLGSPIPGILQARTLEWLPFPSPMHESEEWKWSRSVMSDSSRPHGLQPFFKSQSQPSSHVQSRPRPQSPWTSWLCQIIVCRLTTHDECLLFNQNCWKRKQRKFVPLSQVVRTKYLQLKKSFQLQGHTPKKSHLPDLKGGLLWKSEALLTLARMISSFSRAGAHFNCLRSRGYSYARNKSDFSWALGRMGSE